MQALQFYKRVQELPEYNDKELWSKIAECHEALGTQEDMVAMYEAIMQDDTFPAAIQHDAAVALTHLHLDSGDTVAAEQVCWYRTMPRYMIKHSCMSLHQLCSTPAMKSSLILDTVPTELTNTEHSSAQPLPMLQIWST